MPPLTDHVARLFHGPHASAPAMRVLVLEGINRVFPTGTLPGSAGRHEVRGVGWGGGWGGVY